MNHHLLINSDGDEFLVPVASFKCCFVFISWSDISLGINIDVAAPSVDIHIPFGIIQFGVARIGGHSWRPRSWGRTVWGITPQWWGHLTKKRKVA